MSEGISQSDLDALFAGLPDTTTGAKTEAKEEETGGISQSDLDALFAGLTDTCGSAEPGSKTDIKLKMEEARESLPPAAESQGESLSQDEIDKMLAEFGMG
jgi:hypothetical protein